MFNQLSDNLQSCFKTITGRGRLTEDNIQDALREVRKALLEADVALPVVKTFIEKVKEESIGQKVSNQLSPDQAFIKIVQQQLTQIMGEANEELNLKTQPPAIVLMAGLQGSGKTTSVAKLGRYLKEREKKSVAVVSTDIYRPAAIDQLHRLAEETGLDAIPTPEGASPKKIAKQAVDQAEREQADVLIIDTAGRLHVDDDMMEEIQTLQQTVHPIETLFVVDSMTGQDAANTAKTFNDALELTGVVLTKTDGDARGGAGLSIREITGKPIKFLGTGEKTDALESFHPERIASRILGKGDMMSLIEEAEQKVDQKKAKKVSKKIKKGRSFNMQDFLDQLEQMSQMGGVSSMLNKMPGMGKMDQEAVGQHLNDQKFKRMKAIIQSMNKAERKNPDILNSSRKRRIAQGSGTELQDVNRLLKQFNQMRKMMKKMKKGGMKGMMQQMQQMQGSMPGGGQNGMPF